MEAHMSTREEEPERREGLGGRVRRFVDSELSRVLNKENPPERAESGTPYDTEPRHPATATPADSGSDTEVTTRDTGVTTSRGSEDHAAQVSQRSRDEVAADGSAERIGLLSDPAGLRDQWQRVQGTFVDDPHRAVQEASALVERTLQEIHQNVSRGQASDPTSTEDLRVSFQRYREFFQRLLSA
jgi:hypothetical protein